MKLVIEPGLLERVAFDAARAAGGPTLRAFQREFADCFDEADPRRREEAFRDVHERWFARLGLRDRLMSVIDEFPRLRAQVERVLVADARSARRQYAELFGGAGARTVAISIDPKLLLEEAAFMRWARHELLHVEDLLDPEFGYDPALRPAGDAPAAEQLARDRYALLWAISIDARLEARGAVGAPDDEVVRARRRAEYARLFGGEGEARHAPAEARGAAPFEAVWTRFRTYRPTHAELLRLCRVQQGRVGGESSNAGDGAGRCRPGSPCPLCRFSTFDWARAADLTTELVGAVRADFPTWSPDDGICGRCAELYRSRSATRSRAEHDGRNRGALATADA